MLPLTNLQFFINPEYLSEASLFLIGVILGSNFTSKFYYRVKPRNTITPVKIKTPPKIIVALTATLICSAINR